MGRVVALDGENTDAGTHRISHYDSSGGRGIWINDLHAESPEILDISGCDNETVNARSGGDHRIDGEVLGLPAMIFAHSRKTMPSIGTIA